MELYERLPPVSTSASPDPTPLVISPELSQLTLCKRQKTAFSGQLSPVEHRQCIDCLTYR